MERTQKHNLLDSLVSAVCTLLTGGEGGQDLERFGTSKRAWLHTCLALPHGMPSPDTFGRVVARRQPQRFRACLLSWTRAGAPRTPGTRIAWEGKPVKASCARATASSPWPRLSAWCAAQGG